MDGVASAISRGVAQLDPNARVLTIERMVGGVSANVFGVEYETVRGATRRVVFREHPDRDFKGQRDGLVEKEFRVLAAVHRAGLAVAEPLLVGEFGLDGEQYLVTEWIDGTTDVAPAQLDVALGQMAEFLAALHGLDPVGIGLDNLERLEDPRASVREYLVECGLGVGAPDLLDRSSLPAPNREGLVHGDYWPGNILWRDGQLVAVIDWEDACIGDPLVDLACARVELLCYYDVSAMDTFTARYLDAHGSNGEVVDTDALALWEMYVSAGALRSMHLWGLNPDTETRRRSLTQGFFDRAARDIERAARS